MGYSSLREFLDVLEERGALATVSAPVSPELEMTEIQTRLLAEGGPAVLYDNIAGPNAPYGAPWPRRVLANLFGTVERVAWAMGREPSELRALGETLAFLNHPEPPATMAEAVALLPVLKAALARKPRTVTKPACQEVVLRG
ncbi:MAG: UbiD family decarboxylase, partial [Alphaproteobacteria bacterium]